MGGPPGGTVAAASELQAHRGAIEYDLLTLAGLTTDDIGGGLTWPVLCSFISHLPPSSAYWREREPEVTSWLTGERNAVLLADIFDLIAAAHTAEGKKALKHPRPGLNPKEKRHLGADPIPIQDFDAWYYNRKE